jgi:Carboxypeptidase regulatory-like domain
MELPMKSDHKISKTVWAVGIFTLSLTVFLVWKYFQPAAAARPQPEPVSHIRSESSSAPIVAADREPADAVPPQFIQIWVQSADGLPVPGATVSGYTIRHWGTIHGPRIQLTTDSHGGVRAGFSPDELVSLELTAGGGDFISRKMMWSVQLGSVIPASYTFKLRTGVSIGGAVVEEMNNPIAGAKISLNRFWGGPDGMDERGDQPDFPSQTVTTDAQGNWLVRGLPEELLDHIALDVSQPDFISMNMTVGANRTTQKQLRAGTMKITLHRGIQGRGLVTDENDYPISGATVWVGRKYSRERQETKTDGSGRFVFRNLTEGDVLFGVTANGREPDNKTFHVQVNMADIVFKLSAGHVVRGVVQDGSGVPVQGVRVSLERSPAEASYDAYEFSATTDENGKFQWDGAPRDALSFYFGKQGFEQKRNVKLAPDQDNTVTLNAPRMLQSLVLDANTEQPVTKFSVGTGTGIWGGSQIYGGVRDHDFSATDGRFTLNLDEPNDNAVQVSADDYAMQTQFFPKSESGIIQLTFRLKPGSALKGVVISSAGAPLPGITVACTSGDSGSSIQLQNGILRSWNLQTKVARTDAEGKFTLGSPPENASTVVAAGPAGFAAAPSEQVRASGVLVLQEFGRIEGTLKIGGAPAADQDLLFSLSAIGINMDFNSYKSTTDQQGHFVIEKVPAGEGSLVRLVKTSANSWTHSHQTPVLVEPGKTTQITLGDSGAVIKGSVRFETPPVDGEALTISGNLSSAMLKMPPFSSPEEARAYMNSPEWKAQIQERKSFALAANADGSFTLDSIPPGTYTLDISATKSGDQAWRNPSVAQSRTTVTIPETSNPYNPISIGEIVLKLTPK